MKRYRLEYGWKSYIDDQGEVAINIAEVGADGLVAIYQQDESFMLKYYDRIETIDKPDVWMLGQRYMEEPEDDPEFRRMKNLMQVREG